MIYLSYCRRLTVLFVVVTLLFAAALPAAGQAKAQRTDSKNALPAVPGPPPLPPDFAMALQNLTLREIGPAVMGGRIDDFAVVESDPSTYFAGTASGGIFKTTNGGMTWQPIFDNEAVSTIGDLAIAPSDPSILWVGTGESNNRQSSSWGNGIYKSIDGGKTWTHMGLKETHHIGRVVIHPRNPDIVYVAAAGRLWGTNKERGVYKTSDGGKTWNQVLFINDDTGVNDIAMDFESPDVLYAGAYQRRRTVYGFSGGGPHGGIYKTVDGGATWNKLFKGLPYEKGGDIGRIGLAIFLRNSRIVYALVEHDQGGIYRSEDKGDTWTRMSDTNPRPSYYSQVIIDPNNDLRVWVLGAPLYFSEDGGKTFIQTRGQRIHSDHHALWINPGNSDHMIIGTDGGIHSTLDGGRNWDFHDNLALAQFYEIGVDMQKPYRICGGLQDNNTWCGPSATTGTAGITNALWVPVGGGDGFYAQVDPTDPNIVFAESQDGNLLRRDMRTGESKSIRPAEKAGEAKYRFQWNSPIVISSHDPRTIYYGGNFVFRSADRGDNWAKISPDLTTGVNRNSLPIMGKIPDRTTLSRHDGVQNYPCVTVISESPLTPQVIWAGTDDGNLQVTRDAGATWRNVADRLAGVPKGTYVSRVVASKHGQGAAYATFDGHRSNDFGIYVFRTTDYGETWQNIGGTLPRNNGVVNVIREHPRNPKLLFAGTEYGAYASWDQGGHWTRLRMNLPTVPVDDIQIHPRDNDLILGTHGRSIWILDDITPLEQMDEKTLTADLQLFDIRPATSWRMFNNAWFGGNREFQGPNPAYGAMIHYFLKSELDPKERVRITILDKEGKQVREITCGGPAPAAPAGMGAMAMMFGGGFGPPRCDPKPGINRAVWDLREGTPPMSPEQQQGMGFFGAAMRGVMVDPGEYAVKVAVVGAPEEGGAGSAAAPEGPGGGTPPGRGTAAAPKWEMSKTVKVEEDPRITFSDADRAARRQAMKQLQTMMMGAMTAQRSLTTLRTNLNTAIEGWKRPGGPRISEEVRKAGEELLKKIDELYPHLGTPPGEQERMGSAGPPLVDRPTPLPQRLGRLLFSLDGFSAAPTASQLEEIKELQEKATPLGEQIRKLVQEDLANLNKMMREAGIPHISASGGGPVTSGRRP